MLKFRNWEFRGRFAAAAFGAWGCLCFSGLAQAQASAKIVPGIGGCFDAVIYNTSQHHLQLSVDYLYKGSNGSYQQGNASCTYASGMATAPGQSCQVHLWPGPVDCADPATTVSALATKWTDMTVIWEQERRAAEIEQTRERENTKALARMLDEKNRRESEDRARHNEEIRRRHEAELAAQRAEQERAIERRRQDPMGLTNGMHGTIPPSQSVAVPSSGSNLTAFEQRVRAEQEARDRQENYSRQLAYDNAARERYDREALQRQQQAEAQAKSARAAAELQRQQMIAAQAEAAERARQEAERREAQSRALNAAQTSLISSSAQQSEQKLESRKVELAKVQRGYESEQDSLDKMLAMMESNAKSRPTAVEKEQGRTFSAEECSKISEQISSSTFPDKADVVPALETRMFVQKSAMRLIDGGCPISNPNPDRAAVRQSLLNDFQTTEKDCNAVKTGGRPCVAQKHF